MRQGLGGASKGRIVKAASREEGNGREEEDGGERKDQLALSSNVTAPHAECVHGLMGLSDDQLRRHPVSDDGRSLEWTCNI